MPPTHDNTVSPFPRSLAYWRERWAADAAERAAADAAADAASPITTYGYRVGRRGPHGCDPFGFGGPTPNLERWRAAHPEGLLTAWEEALDEAGLRAVRAEVAAAWEEALVEERERQALAEELAQELAALAATRADRVRAAYECLPVKARDSWLPAADVPEWAPRTAYAAGARVRLCTHEYVCWHPGTSGTSGPVARLEDLDAELQDGSARWRYLAAIEVAREWAQQYEGARATPFLVMVGGVGTGKTTAGTHAALDLAHAAVEARETARQGAQLLPRVAYWQAAKVAREGLYGPEAAARMAEAREADVLFVDDLGTEVRGAYWEAALQEVLDARYAARQLTCITSNLEVRQLRKDYGDRIADRLSETARIVSVGAASLRRRPQ